MLGLMSLLILKERQPLFQNEIQGNTLKSIVVRHVDHYDKILEEKQYVTTSEIQKISGVLCI